jgi:hypothetical protein
MKTKILRKINQRVRVVEKNDAFVVEHRINGFGDWISLNTFSTHKAALNKKHSYVVMIVLRDLSYRNEFVKRRTKRKE